MTSCLIYRINTILNHTVLEFTTVPFYITRITTPCCIVLYYIWLHSTVSHLNIFLSYLISMHYTILHLHCLMLHCSVSSYRSRLHHSSPLYIILSHIILSHITLHYTTLHYTVLHWPRFKCLIRLTVYNYRCKRNNIKL
jgi:hypothetical protein